MRIAYLIHWNEGAESGVLKKVVHQLAEWKRQGHEPALFLFTCSPNEDWGRLCGDAGIEVVTQVYKGSSGRMADFGLLAKKVRKWRPDVLYHRFDLYYLSLPGLLKAFPSVLEINTNDMAELRAEQGFRYYYHSFTRGKVLAAADGHVYVSHELAESGHYRPYQHASLVIGNGTRLADFPVRRETPPADLTSFSEAPVTLDGSEAPDSRSLSEAQVNPDLCEASDSPSHSQVPPSVSPRLIFIGSAGQPWHGLDHIAELARLKPDWRFDLIGLEAGELLETAGLSTPQRGAGDLPPNLFFHGKMTRDAYQPLLDQADAAIGTLALYRKDMKEASPLKVREYLANGLPVILGCTDTDFPEGAPFLLQLPAEPDNVRSHIGRIEQFVAAWQGRRVDRKLVANLDTSVKETLRLRFMEQVAASRLQGSGGRAGSFS